jgi:hypothetical protein
MVYALGGDAARADVVAFERKWPERCPDVRRQGGKS